MEDLEGTDFELISMPVSETEDILDMANEAPIIRLVNTILKQAVKRPGQRHTYRTLRKVTDCPPQN